MDKRASIAFIAFAVIIAATNLNATTGTFCGFLYPQGAPGSGILPAQYEKICWACASAERSAKAIAAIAIFVLFI